MCFKSCFVVDEMVRKKAQQLVFCPTRLLPSGHRAERWVCSWCLPTLGPCLPNIYERDPVIIRQAFRRKHFWSGSQGRGAEGERGMLAPTHPPTAGWAAGVSPSLQHHLAGPPTGARGAGGFGGRTGGLTKKAWVCSSLSILIFPVCVGICSAWSRISLDAGAHECFPSAFTTVRHELGKPLSLFLLWLSHLRNTCRGWVRLIAGINNP